MEMHTFTAVLRREGDGWVSLCPELNVASQGDTVEHALAMLREAVEGVLESAPREEIEQRLGGQIFVTQFEAAYA